MATIRGDFLSKDLTAEIFSRLPVKSLMRFKCGCKSWYSMIESTDFVSQHLNNYCNNNNNSCLLVAHRGPSDQYIRFVSLPNQSYYESGVQFESAIGPCNGIFCVCSFPEGAEGVCGLWNPAIKEFRALPALPCLPPTIPYTVNIAHAAGFGLDPLTNDYKLVVIRSFNECHDEDYIPYCPPQALVYSLAADSWRDLDDLGIQHNFLLRHGYCYTYLNGMYYWRLCCVAPSHMIVSFDIAKEVFHSLEIKGPDYIEDFEGFWPPKYYDVLALYYESIALYVYKFADESLDIWAMDGGSWIKKITVGSLSRPTYPVGYWKGGQVLLESNNGGLLLFDSCTGEVRNLMPRRGEFRWVSFHIYKESLVSITEQTS